MSSPGLSYFDEDENAEDISMLSPDMQAAYSQLEASNRARAAALEKNVYAPQRELWDKYTKDLEARRAGPSAAENLLALSAALSQPTRYRGFGGMIANVAPVLAEQQKAARAAEDAKRDLLMKYSMETGKLGLEQKRAEIDAAQELAQARFKALSDQYRIANTPKWVQVPDGRGGFTLMQVTPSSMQQRTNARPPGVGPDWTLEQDAAGNTAWVSPDRKQHVEVK